MDRILSKIIIVFLSLIWLLMQTITVVAEPKYMINDFTKYPIPRIDRPEKGVRFKDPTFGTTIVRVTDQEVDEYAGSRGMNNDYSRYDADNADGSYILLTDMHEGAGHPWNLYDGSTFKYLRSLGDIEEPRWDWADPNILYYNEGTKLRKWNLETDQKSIIHDFEKDVPGAGWIGTRGEGDCSVDGMKWGFKTDNRCWIWYDRATGIVNVADERKGWQPTDHVSASPLGGFFTTGGTEDYLGHYSFTPDFSRKVPLAPEHHHSDLAVDVEGNEVHVHHDIVQGEYWLVMRDLRTGEETLLVPNTGLNYRLHISGNAIATPGWALVSTYTDSPPFDPQSWNGNSLYMIELKRNGRVWRIAHTHSPMLDDSAEGRDYWAEAFATINTEGTRVYWGSRWDTITGRFDVYCAELPATWYEDLMGKDRARDARAKCRATILRNLGEAAALQYDDCIGDGNGCP